MSSFDATHADSERSAVDARLAPPEARYEVHDGELVHVPPADEPHATRHSKTVALVEAHTGSEFDVACDLLTRASETDDVAPDVSVFPWARHPETGGRQLEHLAFEIVSTESLRHAGRKAAKLVGRGVRRVFAIDVERERALEWSSALGTWSVLDSRAYIEDVALAVPLPIDALVHVAKTDDVVARALLAKQNPVLIAVRAQDRTESFAEGMQHGLAEGMQHGLAQGMQHGLAQGMQHGLAQGMQHGLAQGMQHGLAQGKAGALLVLLHARGLVPASDDRARIFQERDPDRLDRWIARAITCADLEALLAEP
jgi:Uma2 family endonuclease